MKCLMLVCMLLCITNVHAQNKDIDWLRSINKSRTPTTDHIMVGLTNSVYPVAGAIPVAQLIYGYTKHDSTTIHYAWLNVIGIGLNTVVTFGLKFGIHRDRPYTSYADINPYQHDTDPSFPSGHTSFAFETATALSMQYPHWYIIAPAYAWAGTVAYSRMYLGMHYPTDVLAGAIIGTGSALLSYKLNQWLHTHHKLSLIHI